MILPPLVSWFRVNGRNLPWRAVNLDNLHPDPYAVLVSEVMLQQTQVSTVIPFFERWMAHFPTVQSLVEARDDEIHKLWEGLGYYRRARFLTQAACVIAEHGWPEDVEGLRQLPGVGPYTAAALASIAFQHPEPALDGNAFRVLARVLGILEDPRETPYALGDWLRPALKAFGPSRLTQAVMELGAMICTPRPDCPSCPLRAVCRACQQGLVGCIPPPRPRSIVTVTKIWLVAVCAQGHWLVCHPVRTGLLAGLWRWPSFEREIETVANQSAEYAKTYSFLETRSWLGWTQVYSHRKEGVEPIAIEIEERFDIPGTSWLPSEALTLLPMGKRDQKMRNLLAKPPDNVAAETIPASELIQRILALSPRSAE